MYTSMDSPPHGPRGAPPCHPEVLISVIDDEPMVARAVRRHLTVGGYTVHGYGSAREALSSETVLGSTLILLDVRLADECGIATCKQLRELGYEGGIFMLSGVQDPAVKEQAFEAGADDYIVKPFDPTELRARLRALLRRRSPVEAPSTRSDAIAAPAAEESRTSLTVLVVDDDQGRLDSIALHLTRRGYDVARALTGQEALDALPRMVPTVVIAALRLADVTAVELCGAAMASPRPAIVIFLNDSLGVPEALTALRAGASDFVRSPVDYDELVTRIEVHVRSRGIRRMLASGASGARWTGRAPEYRAGSAGPEVVTPAEGLILRRPRPPRRAGARARILVQDSDALTGRALVTVLQLRGFAVTSMREPLTSMVAALWRDRDALVLHVGEDEKGAFATCSALRDKAFPVAVIATAGSVTQSLRDRALKAGADVVVPFYDIVRELESRFPAVAARAPSSHASTQETAGSALHAVLTRSERSLFRVLHDAGADGVDEEELQSRASSASIGAVVAHMKRMRRKLAVFGIDIRARKGRYRLVRPFGS